TLVSEFRKHLAAKGCDDVFTKAIDALAEHPSSRLELIRDWTRGFLLNRDGENSYLEEAAAILFCGDDMKRSVVNSSTSATIEEMRGNHPLIQGQTYRFDYLAFQEKLTRFEGEIVPRFERCHQIKQQLVERE